MNVCLIDDGVWYFGLIIGYILCDFNMCNVVCVCGIGFLECGLVYLICFVFDCVGKVKSLEYFY